MNQITRHYIYSLASTDARSNNVPARDAQGKFIPNYGLTALLNVDSNSRLLQLNREIERCLVKRKNKIEKMISLESVYNSSKTPLSVINKFEIKLNNELKEVEKLESDIGAERKRLINIGLTPPENNKYNNDYDYIKKKNFDWKSFRRWTSIALTFIFIEIFFGLSLWDTMRENKSIIQTILRISSSGILFFTVYLAEVKFKKTKSRVYFGYIILAMIFLVFMLIGPVVINYFCMDDIVGVSDSSNYSIKDSKQTTKDIEIKKSVSDFLLQYDFLIGIVAILIFKLIGFLHIERPISANNQTIHNPAFKHLLNLYDQNKTKMSSIKQLETKLREIKIEPSKLALSIRQELLNLKNEIEDLELKIQDLKNSQNKIFQKLQSNINVYQADFEAIYNVNTPSLTPIWPTKIDILHYFNIQNLY